MGISLQLALGALVFVVPGTREVLNAFSQLLDGFFRAADFGASFVFGRNIVPLPDRPADVNLGYIFAFRALPTVVFFSGLMALLYNIGVIQWVTQIFARLFYAVMRLSGAEALSGAANIFVGIEAAIVVRPSMLIFSALSFLTFLDIWSRPRSLPFRPALSCRKLWYRKLRCR
jgi:CNT family concentrative nucleoside transporter